MLGYMLLFAFGIQTLAMLSVLGYAGYLAWQLWLWWKPYALGASSDWQALYAASFSHTLKLLPTDTVHLAPDAQHIVLHALILVTLIATVMAVARMQHL